MTRPHAHRAAIALALSLGIFAAAANAQPADASAVLAKVDAVRSPSDNFVFQVRLDSQTAQAATLSEFQVSVRDSTKSLVVYRLPVKQKGRSMLFDGPDMWIFIPGTSRPVRISPQQQLTGAVSNADVARVVFNLDYTAASVEKQEWEGRPALKLELQARQPNAAYQRIQLWVTDKDYRPIQAGFYSLSGKLLRTIQYGGYSPILGEQRPTVLKIQDEINRSVSATLTYSNFKVQETPAEYYQPSYLGTLSH